MKEYDLETAKGKFEVLSDYIALEKRCAVIDSDRCLCNSILEAIEIALHGDLPSDFMLSFPLVDEAYHIKNQEQSIMDRCRELEAERDGYRNGLEQIRYISDSLFASNNELGAKVKALLAENAELRKRLNVSVVE